MTPRSAHTMLARRLATLTAVAGLTLATGQSGPPAHDHAAMAAPAAQAPGSYLETFDQYADVMQPLAVAPPAQGVPGLDIMVHSRDSGTWGTLEPMEAEHDAMCGAPPATHHFDGQYEQAAFLCAANTHLMTSAKAIGYEAIYLTPSQQVDVSGGEAVISWDVSTLRNSDRDWWDVWITPYDDALVAPLESWLPALTGEPRRAIHVRMTGVQGQTTVFLERYGEFAVTEQDGCTGCQYESFLTPSASRRDTFQLRLSATRAALSMPQYGRSFFDHAFAAPLDFGRAVVQFGHHSYNPEKDCPAGLVGGQVGCRGGTWHWDNLSISPAVPYTQIRAVERGALPGGVGVPMRFTLPQPAPADAALRVEAVGEGYEVSVDQGATWAPLALRPSGRARTATDYEGGVKQYWHPIPAGTQAVQLRVTRSGWWGLGMVDHVAAWSLQRPSGPPPTATGVPPTSTPAPQATPTPTPPATGTPTPSPTATQPATGTSTPLPSATATGTPAALPTITCQVQVILNGTPGPLRDCR